MEKTQIKMDHDFAPESSRRAEEAKTITYLPTQPDISVSLLSNVQSCYNKLYMEKTQIKMDHDFAAESSRRAEEAKTITYLPTQPDISVSLLSNVQSCYNKLYMEKTQIKMDHDFAADFQPPAVEAKIMIHFNSAAVKVS